MATFRTEFRRPSWKRIFFYFPYISTHSRDLRYKSRGKFSDSHNYALFFIIIILTFKLVIGRRFGSFIAVPHHVIRNCANLSSFKSIGDLTVRSLTVTHFRVAGVTKYTSGRIIVVHRTPNRPRKFWLVQI